MNSPARILSAIALLSFALGAQALSEQPTSVQPVALSGITPTQPGLHLVLNAGITYGGDTIHVAPYTNGSTQDIKAGSLVQLGIGGLYQFENDPVALMLSANYHVDAAGGSNGSDTFSRFPIEALVYYTGKERFRIGGGVRIVNSPEWVYTVNGVTEKATFDNTTGLVAEIGYHLTRKAWLNLRFVSEKYKANTYTAPNGVTYSQAGRAPFSGSHMGVNFTFEF